jgi:SAM-dependent methyltransferase
VTAGGSLNWILKPRMMIDSKRARQVVKDLSRSALPLSVRKRLAIALNRQKCLQDSVKYWWTRELLQDFAEGDRNEYHRFLWSNHLAYALTYEVDFKYGSGKLPGSRRLFVQDLQNHLNGQGSGSENVRSVFDVGCSLGYQLRYMETDVFPSATILEGIDIDRYAVSQGNDHLRKSGSRIRLMYGDIRNLDRAMGDNTYEIVISTGTLMYLDEEGAARVVATMTEHCGIMIGVSGPAHPYVDNGGLRHSIIRDPDGSFIHNLDSMIERSGWKVCGRRWEGTRRVDGHTIYFVFAIRR